MNQNFEVALVNLELLIGNLEMMGLDDLAKLANDSASAICDIQAMTSSEGDTPALDDQQVLAYLDESDQSLRRSLAFFFKISTIDGLKSTYPHLEARGVAPALKMISDIEIDNTKFVSKTKSIISDCNDDIILSLMEI